MRQGKRFGLSAIEKSDIWSRWKAGQSLHEIGRAFDKPHTSIRCLLLPRGGIPPECAGAPVWPSPGLSERTSLEKKCNTTWAQAQNFARVSPLFSRSRVEGRQQNSPSVATFEPFFPQPSYGQRVSMSSNGVNQDSVVNLWEARSDLVHLVLLFEIIAEKGFSLAHAVAVITVGGEVGFFAVRVASVQRLCVGLGR